jgi:hypothetical protein
MLETSRIVSASNQKSIECNRKEGRISATTRVVSPAARTKKLARNQSCRANGGMPDG